MKHHYVKTRLSTETNMYDVMISVQTLSPIYPSFPPTSHQFQSQIRMTDHHFISKYRN